MRVALYNRLGRRFGNLEVVQGLLLAAPAVGERQMRAG